MTYYILTVIFLMAFLIETIVTGKVLMHHQNLKKYMSTPMKYWAISSMVLISTSNVLGWLWLKRHYEDFGHIDYGNYIQAFFAISIMSLFLWVLIFHKNRFEK